MGKPTGFLEYKRETAKVLPPKVPGSRISMSSGLRSAKKNRPFRAHAVWHAEFLSVSQA